MHASAASRSCPGRRSAASARPTARPTSTRCAPPPRARRLAAAGRAGLAALARPDRDPDPRREPPGEHHRLGAAPPSSSCRRTSSTRSPRPPRPRWTTSSRRASRCAARPCRCCARATRRRSSTSTRSSTRSTCPTGRSCGRAAWRWRAASPPARCSGARVLELGCGLGLPSLAAALAGGRVLATDWSPQAIELLRENAERNGAELETAIVDWQRPAPLARARAVGPRARRRPALRAPQRRAAARAAAARCSATRGELWLADPGRAPAEDFLAGVRAARRGRRRAGDGLPSAPGMSDRRLPPRPAHRPPAVAEGHPRARRGRRGVRADAAARLARRAGAAPARPQPARAGAARRRTARGARPARRPARRQRHRRRDRPARRRPPPRAPRRARAHQLRRLRALLPAAVPPAAARRARARRRRGDRRHAAGARRAAAADRLRQARQAPDRARGHRRLGGAEPPTRPPSGATSARVLRGVDARHLLDAVPRAAARSRSRSRSRGRARTGSSSRPRWPSGSPPTSRDATIEWIDDSWTFVPEDRPHELAAILRAAAGVSSQ